MPPQPLLRVQELSVQRRGALILNRLSFSLAEGELVGLVGPNGVGKTTLLEVLVGRLRPASGELWWRGEQWPWAWELSRRARMGVGYLPQGPSVFRQLSVWENLRAVPTRDDTDLEAIIERVGLTARLDARAGSLSGGERRRLELARLWAMGSTLLLCDEPFAALDPQGVEAVCAILRELSGQGRCILLTDHRVELVASLCPRLMVLLDGHIARDGKASELRADAFLQERYFSPRDGG
ncbi:MAG: heme ABC exporter ATP-binding protein CcmA [Myxococcota bacterium]|jgi:lipopolysaccharide export system ATP-binding protein|nr:heme ABC exporter ATP-binding protein CcmA [Myxococcota bacterium]